ncbi:MAG: HAMP domain-containing histidine kinase [Eubacterium sp.]|nr:HAMP domain-containing histidine kinase [Eubacterium sp.]
MKKRTNMDLRTRIGLAFLAVIIIPVFFGSVFLISMLTNASPQLKSAVLEIIVMILIILTVTCIAVGLWIYRGVMNPIRELQTAAQNIRDGNLNYSVSGRGVREINDLCDDFEEMRIRLKESAEEKISSDSKSKELISNISHDLKTPVTTIKGYAEGIIDGVAATPEKQKKYIRTIYNKAVEIERLIDELTTYSKIEANRIPYNFQKIHVRDYFIDCVDELNLELESQNIQLNYFNYLTGEPLIIADPEQMRRVINNIVGNSVKYMDKPAGIINIRLRDVDEFIQIEIEDNGKGIAQKDISRVFDRFYRSDTARTSRGGSGIGLSIVKKIVEDHEGKVWATSREGVGTVIYFVLRKYQEVENEQNTDH